MKKQHFTITVMCADSWNYLKVSVGQIVKGNVVYDDANVPAGGHYRIGTDRDNGNDVGANELQQNIFIHIDNPITAPTLFEFGAGKGWPYIDFLNGKIAGIFFDGGSAFTRYDDMNISGTLFCAHGRNEFSNPNTGEYETDKEWNVSGKLSFTLLESLSTPETPSNLHIK